MARMIPPQIPNAQRGEKQIFELLKPHPATADWTVIHSVEVGRQEIDFLIMRPNGTAVCLEVKDDTYTVTENAEWFRNSEIAEAKRAGRKPKAERKAPHVQVSSVMMSLRTKLENLGGAPNIDEKLRRNLSKLPSWQCAVAFTNIRGGWPDRKPHPQNCTILDATVSGNGDLLVRELDALLRNVDVPRDCVPLNNDVIEFLTNYILTNHKPSGFDMEDEAWKSIIQDSEGRLLELTERQGLILRGARENCRLVVEGGAGTGKTLLAQRLAEERVAAGDRVAFLCHHPKVAAAIQPRFNKKEFKNKLLVRDTHQFAKWLFKDSPVSKNRQLQERYMEYEYDINLSFEDREGRILDIAYADDRQRAGSVVIRGIFQLAADATKEKPPQFDYLVIDEWQRMGESGFFQVLDNVLEGGMKNGRWTIFADHSDQSPSIYPNKYNSGHVYFDPKKTLDALLEEGGAARLSLDFNCRNTRNIFDRMQQFSASESESESDFELHPYPGAPEGVDVRTSTYTSHDELKEILGAEFRRLQEMGVEQRDVVVLIPEMVDDDIAHFLDAYDLIDEAGYGPKAWKLSDISDSKFTSLARNGVTVCRASQFGGLESRIVVAVVAWVDVDQPNFEKDWYRCELYIALSRATSELVILVDERMRSDYKEKLGVREFTR